MISTHEKAKSDMHTLSAYVANKPGVLARIAQVFSRRGYNIDSLVVSPAGDGSFSRMTITAQGDPSGLDQVIAQVNKLVDVLHCFDHTGQEIVVKELLLIKLKVLGDQRGEVLQISEHFKANSQDLTETSMILMATGSTEKIDSFIRMLSAYEIIELVRTGKVVMARGEDIT